MKLAGDIGVGGVFRKPPSLTLALDKFLSVDRNFYLIASIVYSFLGFYLCAGVEHTIKSRQAYSYNKRFNVPIRITHSWRGNSLEVQYPPVECRRCKEKDGTVDLQSRQGAKSPPIPQSPPLFS